MDLAHWMSALRLDASPIEVVPNVQHEVGITLWRAFLHLGRYKRLGMRVDVSAKMTVRGTDRSCAHAVCHVFGGASCTPVPGHRMGSGGMAAAVLDDGLRSPGSHAEQGTPIANGKEMLQLPARDPHRLPRGAVVRLHVARNLEAPSPRQPHAAGRSVVGRRARRDGHRVVGRRAGGASYRSVGGSVGGGVGGAVHGVVHGAVHRRRRVIRCLPLRALRQPGIVEAKIGLSALLRLLGRLIGLPPGLLPAELAELLAAELHRHEAAGRAGVALVLEDRVIHSR